jgi:hypothetical protein
MCSYEDDLSFYENQASEMICEDIKWLDGVKMNINLGFHASKNTKF